MKLKQTDNAHRLICVQTAEGPRMIPYLLERSRKVRRMYLQFDDPAYVTLKLPSRYSEKSGQRFIQEHADWICETLDSQPKVLSLYRFLVKHPRLAIAGAWYRVELRFQKGAYGYVVDQQRRVACLAMNSGLPPESQLKDVLRSLAREHLTERVRYLEPRVGVRAHGITIRDQKSRWGSCSETGGLSLNWRLLLISPKLQDHVLLHELAHIRHFDHSKGFHAFLKSLDPKSSDHARRLHQEANTVFPLAR